MAERRMFHTSVVESDGFLDLPVSSQALYFHLGMHADDDGFINSTKQVARSVGCSVEDIDRLVQAGFLLQVEDMFVICHWRVANSLRADRLRMPKYPKIARKIYLCEDRTYSLSRPKGTKNFWCDRKSLLQCKGFPDSQESEDDIPTDSKWIPAGAEVPEKRIPKRVEVRSKENISKENISKEPRRTEGGEVVAAEDSAAQNSDSELKYLNGNLGKGVVLMSQEQMESLLEILGLDSFDHYVQRLADYILKNNAKIKNHYATILKWWEEDRGV